MKHVVLWISLHYEVIWALPMAAFERYSAIATLSANFLFGYYFLASSRNAMFFLEGAWRYIIWDTVGGKLMPAAEVAQKSLVAVMLSYYFPVLCVSKKMST